jgi:catechol 2,3-dioxygenase-like lactoylglutathione lyase family enzyme
MQSLPLIDHTGIGVADVPRSAVFYDAVLGALGMRRVAQMATASTIPSSGSIVFIRTA